MSKTNEHKIRIELDFKSENPIETCEITRAMASTMHRLLYEACGEYGVDLGRILLRTNEVYHEGAGVEC